MVLSAVDFLFGMRIVACVASQPKWTTILCQLTRIFHGQQPAVPGPGVIGYVNHGLEITDSVVMCS